MTRIPLPRGRHLEIGDAPLVMGIVNVTPDSFSDGGVHFRASDAVASALAMTADGAAIVDVGGESTRPGSDRVSGEDEIARVIPVVEGIRRESDVVISIDTMKSSVAMAALAAGADIVNDVTALRFDAKMAEVVASAGAAVVLMHMRGEPKTMQDQIRLGDVIGEVCSELAERRAAAIAAGIAPEAILVDPGLGFGKAFEHNLEILARAAELAEIAPMVIGASRKAFVGHLTGRPAGSERMAGSLAAVAAAAVAGAAVVRVHDVKETVDFIKVWRAIQGASE